MPQEKQARSGSAAAGGGMLVLWLTMQGCGWLRQQWLPLLPQTGAAAVSLLLQLLMLGIPLIVILRLLRCPAALLCPMKKGRNGSPWLIPAGLAVLVAANFITTLLLRLFGEGALPDPPPLPEGGAALLCTFAEAVLLPALLEELLFRGAVLHALCPAGGRTAILLSALLFMGAHGSPSQWLPALAAGLLLGTLALYTGTLRWGILLHLCNNLIAWGAAYHPSAVTSVILPAVLVLLGLLSIPALRRMPGRVFPQGSLRTAVTLPLLLSLILLLGSAFLPAL